MLEFLANVQGDNVHSHPGLFYCLHEAHISYLIGKGEFEQARQFFRDKVEPLSCDEDSLYRPTDLELRVDKLKDMVNNNSLPPDFVKENVRVAVLDYLQLYFAESLGEKDLDTSISAKCFLSLPWLGR